MKLSIIIPIYNVEKYVQKCLNSVFVQNGLSIDYEVIIVNDGTQDHSMDVVNEYNNIYSNILVINQTNKGLSAARNAGLKKAKGDYVWFVDSDDAIANDSIPQVISYICKYNMDILGFDIRKINETDKSFTIEQVFWNKHNENCYNHIINNLSLIFSLQTGMVQRYIFKRDFLLENNLLFYEGIIYEDEEFLPRAFCLCNSFYFSHYVSYNYLIREKDSIMSVYSMKSLYDTLTIISSYKNFIIKYSSINKMAKMFIYNRIFDQSYWLLSLNANKNLSQYESFKYNNISTLRKNCIKSAIKSIRVNHKITRLIKLCIILLIPNHAFEK